MSNPQENPCQECENCLKVLQIVLDNEASLSETEFVKNHIAQCEHCFECYEVDKTLKDSVKEKIMRIQTPNDLKERILSKLTEITII